MTIEEVSVLFDTGRKGDAKAATRLFEHGGKDIELDDDEDRKDGEGSVHHVGDVDVEKELQTRDVSRAV